MAKWQLSALINEKRDGEENGATETRREESEGQALFLFVTSLWSVERPPLKPHSPASHLRLRDPDEHRGSHCAVLPVRPQIPVPLFLRFFMAVPNPVSLPRIIASCCPSLLLELRVSSFSFFFSRNRIQVSSWKPQIPSLYRGSHPIVLHFFFWS